MAGPQPKRDSRCPLFASQALTNTNTEHTERVSGRCVEALSGHRGHKHYPDQEKPSRRAEMMLTKACCKTVSSSYQGTTSVVPEGGAASTRALAPAPPAAKAATPFAVVSARLKPCPDTNHFLTSLR